MGMFDRIMVPCPECGTRIEAQTKSGACVLETYDLEDAPFKELADVNRHAPFECDCGCEFKVQVQTMATTKKL